MNSDDFIKAHNELTQGVWVVWKQDGSIGIFSTSDKASEYSNTLDENVVIAPYVIDEPNYGNIPTKELL